MKESNIENLIQVSLNRHGAYFMYSVPQVKRGIRGKTKGKVDEVLVVGVPLKNVESYCEKANLIITNKAVYEGDLDNPILYLNEEGTAYEKANHSI